MTCNGWRSADIHQAILTTFGLAANTYALTQLRYDRGASGT